MLDKIKLCKHHKGDVYCRFCFGSHDCFEQEDDLNKIHQREKLKINQKRIFANSLLKECDEMDKKLDEYISELKTKREFR